MSNRKWHNRFAFAAAACLAPAAAFAYLIAGEGYTSLDYAQSGLVAQWDAREYSGRGVSGGGNWRDLIGGRMLFLNGSAYDRELGTTRANGAFYYGWMFAGDTDFLSTNGTVTVEIAISMHKYDSQSIFTGPRDSRIGIGYSYSGATGWYFYNTSVGERYAYKPKIARNWDKLPELWILSVCYTNGFVDFDHTYLNGTLATLSSTTPSTAAHGVPDDCLRVMSDAPTSSTCSSMCPQTYHAIRVYNRKLTAAEAENHRLLDMKRYAKKDYYVEKQLDYSFRVKSGTVTVGGVTYGAGDFVYYRPDEATAVSAAENAVIVPRADGATQIAIADGAVTLQVDDGGAMTYLKAVALGATATLNVPAKGLNVATLAAETGATVSGTGLLVSTPATCPVDYANYRSATAAWTGWPSGGTAYVPVGSNLTVTASAAAALDAIVFLDDGTDAAKGSRVSCADTDALTFKASVAGPGIVSLANASTLTVTGDSRHFTGNFVVSNAVTWVRSEYGLGGPASRAAEVRVATDIKIHFDNDESVFTLRAPMTIGSMTSGGYEYIQSESADKTLVFAEDFERKNYNAIVGGRMVFSNHVVFRKWYKTYGTNYSPYLSDADGTLTFEGPVSFGQSDFYMAAHKGKVTYAGQISSCHQISFPNMTLGAPHVCGYCSSAYPHSDSARTRFAIWAGYTLNLGGFDQDYQYVKNGTYTFTSATPARIRVMDASSQTINAKFTGAAGFATWTDVTSTNTLTGAVVSDTTGTLEAETGTIKLANGYQWLGHKVVMKKGTIIVSDTAKFGRKTCVYIDAALGGAMVLPDGGSLDVRALKVDGVWKAAGTYGGAAALAAGKIDADHSLACFGTESTGVLVVKRNTGDPLALRIIVR